MRSNWHSVSLGELIIHSRGGTAFLKTEYCNEGIPVLAKGDVKPFGRVEHSGRYVNEDYASEKHFPLTKPGEFIVTTRDLTLDADFLALVSQVPVDRQYLVNQGSTVFSIDENLVVPRYLVYWCSGPMYRRYIKSAFVGSTQIHIRQEDLFAAPVYLPPLKEQIAISHILGTLDDKIELNRRMNETLEEIARAIFKSWFVDFDPVRAKAEGRPTGLPEHIDKLFPDSFVDSELGEIPEGWRVVCLSEVSDVVDCLHSRKPERQEKGPLLIQLSNVRDDGHLDFSDPFSISDKDYNLWTKRIEIRTGDLVITKTGRVGAVGQMPIGYQAALGRNLVGLRAKHEVSTPGFLRDALMSDRLKREMVQNTNAGTILKSLHVKAIERLRIAFPVIALIYAHENLVSNVHNRQESCNEESRLLSSLRDTLLPKLISGELRIEDPDRFLEEHIESTKAGA